MVNLTPELKEKLLGYVRISIKQDKSVEQTIIKLIELSKQFTIEDIKQRDNLECGISYRSGSPELFLWALYLICEYWTLNILKQKADDGHCYYHTKPCLKSRKFHKDLFNEAKESFEEIAKMTSMEANMK